MNRQALDLKGKKKSSPTLEGKKITGEPGKKTGPRYLEIPKSLGSLECAVRPGWD